MRTPTFSLATLAALGACGGADALPRDLGIADIPLAHGATTPTPERVALGKSLFFDPRLSAGGAMSCATCHQPDKAWTDGERRSRRHDGTTNTRNTPTLYNVGYLETLFWDGRAADLEAAVTMSLTEQLGSEPADVAAALAGVEGYEAPFAAAYGEGPTQANVVDALASFIRSLQSADSPYDDYKVNRSQAASTTKARLGESLFTGRAGCIACHLPPLFTDGTFHNTGIGINDVPPDLGAGPVHQQERWQHAFKTPGLRGAGLTGPYFHDGSAATLEDAVRIMASGGYENPNRDPALMDRGLKDDEIEQIAAFLRSLTGPEPNSAPTLPQ